MLMIIVWSIVVGVPGLFLLWFIMNVLGILGLLADGPDYSHEVSGKVLDTSDNKWKTPEHMEADAMYNALNHDTKTGYIG